MRRPPIANAFIRRSMFCDPRADTEYSDQMVKSDSATRKRLKTGWYEPPSVLSSCQDGTNEITTAKWLMMSLSDITQRHSLHVTCWVIRQTCALRITQRSRIGTEFANCATHSKIFTLYLCDSSALHHSNNFIFGCCCDIGSLLQALREQNTYEKSTQQNLSLSDATPRCHIIRQCAS